MKDLLIVGTGSNVEEVIHFINTYKLYNIIGFSVNQKYMQGETFHGLPVYPLESIEEYVDPQNVFTYVAISWYNYLNKYKKEKFDYLAEKGYRFGNLISPFARIHTDKIGQGNLIMDSVYIGYDCTIGDNNVIMHGVNIAHYSRIENHNTFAPNSTILGHVKIGNRNFLGASSLIFNRIDISDKCIIGAGSIIKKKMGNNSVSISGGSKITQLDDESVELLMQPIKKE